MSNDREVFCCAQTDIINYHAKRSCYTKGVRGYYAPGGREQAFNDKLITKEEYEKSYKDMFYDEFGFDGFSQYIDAVANSKGDCFVTLNKNLIKRRDELEKKFKLKIISTEELEKMVDKQKLGIFESPIKITKGDLLW